MNKEVYELISYKDIQNGDNSVDLFIQQGKRIKELQGNNNTLKRSRAHFKKVAQNLVYLLEKLNRFIGEPQTQDLNYYKVIEDTKSYIEKLKQAQKQLAISELEKTLVLIQNAVNLESPEYNLVGLYDAIVRRIRELKGEQKDE